MTDIQTLLNAVRTAHASFEASGGMKALDDSNVWTFYEQWSESSLTLWKTIRAGVADGKTLLCTLESGKLVEIGTIGIMVNTDEIRYAQQPNAQFVLSGFSLRYATLMEWRQDHGEVLCPTSVLPSHHI